ncbi:hypothetical protein PC9H_011048 [Pleurotus ostreatus]|uniref:Uncharacterized protein n=2 Tax=Pleurotus TaxID=5320 RepID=A0A8H6ZN91_PLEOS|nr:uncharacterized protein PC9H_011048 [Pleurotus ostreatus]KAF7422884.1 hypothetical protein PC9H_011048 [Pleurotus ostreatus]KAG9227267.1 hypothetical protein CCMSSC00406_0004194 [Pleurotus cornucopiae]KAJ8691150.1 hypothetical protein PTI98_010747 [Pleurotus ostreatus]
MGLLPTARRRARVSDPVPVASTSRGSITSGPRVSTSTTGKRRLCPARSTDKEDATRASGQGVATRKRRRVSSPRPDVLFRPKKRQRARVTTDPNVIEIPSSPSPPPRPIRSKGQTGTREVISLVSDSEDDSDPVSHSSKPASLPVSANDVRAPIETPLRGLNEIGGPFTNEDEHLVAEQLAPSIPSTPDSIPLHSQVAHATPSAIEECLRDGRKTIKSVLHLLPHHLRSSLQPLPSLVSRLTTPTPAVNASDSSPQDSPREPPHPRPCPRPLKRPSVPPDTLGLSDLPKELPVPLVTGDPNPISLKTSIKSPGADDIESPSSPARKRRRLNKLTSSPISPSVRWIRPTAVENMGCHHSLWSPRLVREEEAAVVSDSQREVKGGRKVVQNGYESEEPMEAEEEEVDELISSDVEGKGNNADDAPQFSPLLPDARPNETTLPSRPSSPTKPRPKSSFSPSLFSRVLNLQRSNTSSTPPSLPFLSPSRSSASLSSATPRSPPFDNLPSLVGAVSITASPIPKASSMQFSWAMDTDPLDDIEDEDFGNMVLAYPS